MPSRQRLSASFGTNTIGVCRIGAFKTNTWSSDLKKHLVLVIFLTSLATAQVNVIHDCKAKGYPADDTAALQACFDANPGKHYIFPKVNKSTDYDYKISSPLRVKGREPWLQGEIGNGLGYGGVNILAPNGGLILEQPDTFVPKVQGLCLLGHSPAPNTANGIEVRAAGTQLIDICASYFGGNGVFINGDVNRGNNSNLTKMYGTNRLAGNGKDGLHIEGHDTQVGIFEGIDAEQNAGWGINEQSAIGNVFVQPHGSENAAGCYNTKQASVQSGVWINPYCEGGQPHSNYGSWNIVLGGFNGGTPGNQVYTASGWQGWTYELSNPIPDGNIALRLKAGESRMLLFFKGDSEVSRLVVDKDGNWSFNGFQFHSNGIAFLPTSFRLGPRLFQSSGTLMTNPKCGDAEVRWNDSPQIAVGDPVGWRCIAGKWHSFGEIRE
jgi:hypothetical protein